MAPILSSGGVEYLGKREGQEGENHGSIETTTDSHSCVIEKIVGRKGG